MIKFAIVDDDPAQRELLEKYLKQYFTDNAGSYTVDFFTNGDGITNHYQGDYDVILMDIDMPLVDGYSAALQIREQDPDVVILFITNLTQYAIKGYAVGALDYVLKPVTYFAFSQFIQRAVKRIHKDNAASLLLRTGNSMKKQLVSEICYLESRDHYLLLHTTGGAYETPGKMKEMEQKLEAYGFLRCHMSFLVNPKYVTGYKEDYVMINDEAVPVSRSKKKEFFKALIDYMNR